MRHILTSLFLALILIWPTAMRAQQTQVFTGSAHNVTVGQHAALTLELTTNADGTYGLSIAFDNVNLFGDATATGAAPRAVDGAPVCAAGHECILFNGTLALDHRGGFPDGTTTSFDLSLDIDRTGGVIRGVYHIGPLAPFAFEQYGTITLSTPVS